MEEQIPLNAMSSNRKKKSQAMRIVRTVGQAFEVCHKLSLALVTSNTIEEVHSLADNEEVDALHDHSNKTKSQGDGASEPNSCDTQEEQSAGKPLNLTENQISQHPANEDTCKKTDIEESRITQNCNLKVSDPNVYQHIQLLKEQLELQNQQLKSVMTQIQILRDQLTAEKSARIEAQNQNHLLLIHNRELLEHIQKLVNRIYEIEGKYVKEKSSEVSGMHESFHLSPPPAPDSHLYLDKMKYLSSMNKIGTVQESQLHNFKSLSEMSKNSYTAGHLENHFAGEPFAKCSFPSNLPKQSSITRSCGSTNSPKPDVSFNNAGFSLPTSPSYFSPSLEALFKPDSFVCSSPKQTRKIRNANSVDDALDFSPTNAVPHSPSHSQSSTNPGHKSKTQKVFDFEHTPATYSSSSLFSCHENLGNDFKVNSNSHNASHHTSHESNASNKDSFIAQVTRDLAKMSTVDKCLLESAPGNKSYGDSFSLFKS